jgi:antitoxin ParD1/3/4
MTLNVSLTPQLEEFVREKVISGRYNSASEVVREALRLMHSYEGLRESALVKLRCDVEAGWQQIDEGKVTEFDPDRVKRRGSQKLAKVRKQQR